LGATPTLDAAGVSVLFCHPHIHPGKKEGTIMAHLTSRVGYRDLIRRLNKAAQCAPESELLYEILAMLFSAREAELVAKLPLRPFTAETAAKAWRLSLKESEAVLERLASRALLVDVQLAGQTEYVLPPPMAGFFEFALMRYRDDIDQKKLAGLYEEYITQSDDFLTALFAEGTTQLGRVFVQEGQLGSEPSLHVLDYEKASEVIETASNIGVGLCYCRHKKMHAGDACQADLDICMTFGTVASSLIRSGYARQVEKSECRELLHRASEQNLVQFGENVQREISFICNCCGCCCEAMAAARRFGFSQAVQTSNYVVHVADNCSGCGNCLSACPVGVLTLESDGEQGAGRKRAEVEKEHCLGCGVCARNCPRRVLTMQSRPARVITPVNSVHKSVLMAIERGKLQHLLFDNQVLFSHRALAAVTGAILKLPPVKRALASEQIGSRYLGALAERYEARTRDDH
jgi:ferredoxin